MFTTDKSAANAEGMSAPNCSAGTTVIAIAIVSGSQTAVGRATVTVRRSVPRGGGSGPGQGLNTGYLGRGYDPSAPKQGNATGWE